MMTTSSATPSTFFGNINVHNFVSNSTTVTFSSDGSAKKIESGERTENGVKTYSGPSLYIANIGRDEFELLSHTLVENDFANEPDSKEIASLPASVTLTVKYATNEKVIKAGNTGKDTPEMTMILKAIDDLDRKINWTANRK